MRVAFCEAMAELNLPGIKKEYIDGLLKITIPKFDQ